MIWVDIDINFIRAVVHHRCNSAVGGTLTPTFVRSPSTAMLRDFGIDRIASAVQDEAMHAITAPSATFVVVFIISTSLSERDVTSVVALRLAVLRASIVVDFIHITSAMQRLLSSSCRWSRPSCRRDCRFVARWARWRWSRCRS